MSSVPESSLLALVSWEEARQQAIAGQIYAVGRNDLDEARRLVARYLSIPAIRGQADGWFDAQAKRQDRVSVVVHPGGFISSY